MEEVVSQPEMVVVLASLELKVASTELMEASLELKVA